LDLLIIIILSWSPIMLLFMTPASFFFMQHWGLRCLFCNDHDSCECKFIWNFLFEHSKKLFSRTHCVQLPCTNNWKCAFMITFVWTKHPTLCLSLMERIEGKYT
jgi:hypothetical protein